MMNLPNDSTSSVNSKDKELPPIPPSNTSGVDDEILVVKTLKRKNFKKLSLNNNVDSEPIIDVQLPISRPPNSLRPAPLVNVNETIHSTTSNRTSISLNSSVVINHRNIDPDQMASTVDIINQIGNLELNQQGKKSIVRKRQTVISSISPTKSHSDSSPVDDDASPIYSTTSSIKFANKDLVTLKSLGSGNSGSVSKILHIPTQKIMAKKVISIELKIVIQNQIIRELKILHECQSPYIYEFYGAFINNNNTIVICMEYCNCGSLDKVQSLLPNSNKAFPDYILKKLSYSILNGLVYLYENYKIIHRDIKPSNVLMTHKGQFKLCDFGVSRELTNSLAMADTFVGTSTYMSPERIQGLEYGIKSDVWSMGLMLIEVATGHSIWYDEKKPQHNSQGPEGILDLLQRIVNEDPPTLIGRINPSTSQMYDLLLAHFINDCLIKDDKLRKSPWDLLNNRFLEDISNFDKDIKNWAKMIRLLYKENSKE